MNTKILTVCATAFGVTPDQLLTRSRSGPVAGARFAAIYFHRALTRDTIPKIAKSFGRTQSMVGYALRETKNLIANDARFSHRIGEIGMKLKDT